ncbi:MAG: phosphoribosylanthranilate isomerase [Kiritimatiellaeota bacterium]|nr:phosphoribosylanthranilate isomerase [Kiritimatiellota bacterium]
MKKVEFIKICGLTRLEDAKLAAANGADAVGFVAYRKSPRAVSPHAVRAILDKLTTNPDLKKVGVFVNADIDEIDSYLQFGLDTIQLHGDESAGFARECANLKSPTTGKSPEIWKAFSPTSRRNVETFFDFPADKFLVDAFKKGMRGGTGEVMNLELARFAVSVLPKPVILAGGLSPANIAAVLEEVSPYGVDINSGVETSPGIKDHALMLQITGVIRGPSEGDLAP